MKKAILFIALIFLFQSCQKKSQDNSSLEENIINNDSVLLSKTISSDGLNFNLYRQKIAEFIPEGYELNIEAKGDLNNDNIEDAAISITKTTDTTITNRPVLILLKEKNGYYKLEDASQTILEPKYNDNGFECYPDEFFTIKNNSLTIQQNGVGVCGSHYQSYEFLKNKFLLTELSSYGAGAGGSTEWKLDLKKEYFIITNTNYLTDEPKTSKDSIVFKNPFIEFGNKNVQELLDEAYKKYEKQINL